MKLGLALATLFVAGTNSFTIDASRAADQSTHSPPDPRIALIDQAASDGNSEKVQALINEKPDLVFSKDPWNRAPLIWAVQGNREEVVKLLLANHADPNARDDASTTYPDGESALQLAVRTDAVAIAKLLLADNAAFTIHDAAGLGDVTRVSSLLQTNPSLVFSKRAGRTPLHEAAYHGQAKVATVLIAAGALVSAKDVGGQTPLHGAALGAHSGSRKDVAQILIGSVLFNIF